MKKKINPETAAKSIAFLLQRVSDLNGDDVHPYRVENVWLIEQRLDDRGLVEEVVIGMELSEKTNWPYRIYDGQFASTLSFLRGRRACMSFKLIANSSDMDGVMQLFPFPNNVETPWKHLPEKSEKAPSRQVDLASKSEDHLHSPDRRSDF